jgi:hypothetical protein
MVNDSFQKCFFDNWFNVHKLTAQRKKAAKKIQIVLTFFNNWTLYRCRNCLTIDNLKVSALVDVVTKQVIQQESRLAFAKRLQ